MTHRNARLTPVTRAELVEQVLAVWPQSRSGPLVPRLPRDRRQVGTAVQRRRTGRAP